MSSATRRTISHKHVLHSEILAVASAMRKNSRWASTTYFVNLRDSNAVGSNLGLRISSPSTQNAQRQQSTNKAGDLMAGFQDLRTTLHDFDDISHIPLPNLLGPFFAILRSPLSTGPISSAALSSLHHFFVCGLINANAEGLEAAMAELSNTISHIKFEASDSSGDEVVLHKIMTVIHDCLCAYSVGTTLGDVEVCEMLETVLTTCCQMRLSEILRRTAESTMHALVRTVFSRLHVLDPEVEEAKLASYAEEAQEAELKMTVSTQDTAPPAEEGIQEVAVTHDLGSAQEGDVQANDVLTDEQTALLHDHDVPIAEADATPEPVQEPLTAPLTASIPRQEYGLPSILELLRVLINVLDPSDQQHTDSTRLVALNVLNSAFEESGARIIEFPSLQVLILDHGCKFLFQLARSDNMTMLYSALRTISAVFETMRKDLKLQQELFLTFTIDRLAPPPGVAPARVQQLTNAGTISRRNSPRPGTPSTPSQVPIELDADLEKGTATPSKTSVTPARGEIRDLVLEILSRICRHRSFMVDLFTNYDCDSNCENLFERLIEFVTRGVYATAGVGVLDVHQRNMQYLCLDLVLGYINDMANRALGASEPWPAEYPPPEALLQVKSQKKLILTGAARFNAKPKTGVAFLEENKLIYTQLDHGISRERSLATFLKNNARLDKRLLGDFLSKPDNIELLRAFIGLFDFKNKPAAEALREMLESFRLPGEAQQIDRITETFAATYFAAGPAEIKSQDAVYVLAFSIIMLNTDQHNPQVRKKMQFEDYQKNLRGVNGGQDFSPEFLQNIYDSIRKREIVMPEEHTGQLGFEYAWKELLARSRQAGEYLICSTSAFDLEMFKSSWKPVISSITHAFINFDDDSIIQRSVAGFRQCATLAGNFQLNDVFDFVVVSLSQATHLLPDDLPTRVPHYPVVEVESQSVTISNLSVKFGRNFKGQLAAIVLFNIVNGNGNALREGWVQIFEMFQNLFLHSLLPTRMLQMEDFLGGVSMIPLRGAQPRPVARNEGGGLLSALSSYLMTPYNAGEPNVPEASDADIESTLCTMDCITSCRLDELYSEIMQLDIEALTAAVRALEALAHERTVFKLKESDDAPAQGAQERGPYTLPYDPASVFLLETMVSIAYHAPQHIEELWPIVFEHISALLSTPTQYSILLIERAVVGLLRLCLILAQRPSLRDQIYVSFDLLAGLPTTVASAVAEQVISGVMLISQKHLDIIRSSTEWNLFFAVIRSTISQPEAARQAFDLISNLAADSPNQAVKLDNFNGIITVLDDFASLAGNAAESHHRPGRKQEPLTVANSHMVERGNRAIDLMVGLKKTIGSIMDSSGLGKDQAWKQLCLPLLTSLARQSTNAAREVRHNAISQLQRFLLGNLIVFENPSEGLVEEIFNRIVFHLLDDLLKPQVFKRDPQGMAETRLRASALLCKTFMHYEVRPSQAQVDIRLLWVQVLDLLDKLMNVNKGDQLYEAIPESLKNVVLVMNDADMLIAPPAKGQDTRTDRQRTLWSVSNERIERFLPGFLAEVIPPPTPETPTTEEPEQRL